MASELVSVKISKSGELVEVTETYAVSIQTGSGFYPKNRPAPLSTSSSYNFYNKSAISTAADHDYVMIKSSTGGVQKFLYQLVTGVSGSDAREIAKAIIE